MRNLTRARDGADPPVPNALPTDETVGEHERKRTIVLVEADPYLAFLIRLHVPQAVVVEAQPGATAPAIMMLEPDLVIAGVEVSPNPIPDLLDVEDRPRLLAVADAQRTTRAPLPGVDAMLTRPFVPADVDRTIRALLGLGRRAGQPYALPASRIAAWLAPARVGAVALCAVFEVATERVSTLRAAILAIAFVYAMLRWVLRRPTVVAEAADVAIACALVAATGGIGSNYLPFAMVAAAGPGVSKGPRWGALGGLVVVAGSVPSVVSGVASGTVGGREAAAWFILIPLVGATAGFASRVLGMPADEGLSLLVEANRVLSSLYRIARTLPGGLEIGSVADATLQEIRDVLRASAAAVLLSEAGSFVVAASYGLRDPNGAIIQDNATGIGAAIHRNTSIVKHDELHPAAAAALGPHDCWLTAQIRRESLPLGLLIAACPDHARHDANLLVLERLADETAVAVENARLFSQVREISIDQERRRLARELHDGVAQALMHLRYELDFMARYGVGTSEPLRREVQRLTRVADRASSDVRSMILGLRSSVSAEGLIGSLRSYLRDLRSLGGPEIVFDARGEARLRPDIEAEIFRIVQEAVSNALRHAGASTIRVTLYSGVTKLRLLVDDDGAGAHTRRGAQERGGGVGLEAMRERAALIGARLQVGPTQTGWRVELEYDVEERS